MLHLVKQGAMEHPLQTVRDGPQRLPEAIEAVFPQTQVQLCIVHKVLNSFKYVSWKDRKAVAKDLRAIYSAATLEEAEHALENLSERLDSKYPAIGPACTHQSVPGESPIRG